jgi:Flp pilus assembly protein TadD
MAEDGTPKAALRTFSLSDLRIEPIYAGSYTPKIPLPTLGNLDAEVAKFHDSLVINAEVEMNRRHVVPPVKRPNPDVQDMKRMCVECGTYLEDLSEGNNLCGWHKILRERGNVAVVRQPLWSRPSIDESTVLRESPQDAMLDMRPQAPEESGKASSDEQLAAYYRNDTQRPVPKPARQTQVTLARPAFPAQEQAESEQSDEDYSSELAGAGLALYRQRQWEKATFALNEAIKVESDRPRLYYLRALCFYKMSDFGAAQADFVKSLNLDPNYSKANRDYGRLLMTKGYKEAAEHYLTRSMALEPGIRKSRQLLDKLKLIDEPQ